MEQTKKLHAWQFVVVTIIIIVASSFLSYFIPENTHENVSLGATIVLYGVYVGILMWLFHRSGVSVQKIVGPLDTSFKEVFGIISMIFSILMVNVSFLQILEYVSPGFISDVPMRLPLVASDMSLFLIGVLVAIAAPIAEELAFRGGVLSALKTEVSPGKALVATSIIFAIVHPDPQVFLSLTLVGMYLGILYLKTGRLLLAMLGHAINNLFAFAAFTFILTTDFEALGIETSQELSNQDALGAFIIFAIFLPIVIWYFRKNWPSKNPA